MLLGIGCMYCVFFLLVSLGVWVPREEYIHIPGEVSKAARAQVASPRALIRGLQLLSSYPKGSQNIQIKGAQKERRHRPNSIQGNCHDCRA